jgi:hypothetical protein
MYLPFYTFVPRSPSIQLNTEYARRKNFETGRNKHAFELSQLAAESFSDFLARQ